MMTDGFFSVISVSLLTGVVNGAVNEAKMKMQAVRY